MTTEEDFDPRTEVRLPLCSWCRDRFEAGKNNVTIVPVETKEECSMTNSIKYPFTMIMDLLTNKEG